MKKLSFILLAAMLLNATSSFASEPYDPSAPRPGEKIKLLSNEEFFSKADYIIEVEWAKIKSIHYDVGGNYNPDEFYTSIFLIVTRVYKNDKTMPISPGDTLHCISKGGEIRPDPLWASTIVTPYPVDYDTGEMGSPFVMEDKGQAIYFMKKSDFPENPDVSKRSKHPKVSMLQDLPRASIKIGGRTSPGGPVWGLNDLHFENRYELYKYMEQFEGVDVPISDIDHIRWHLKTNSEEFEKYLKERNINWQEYQVRERQRSDSLMHNRMMEYQRRQQEKKRVNRGH